MKSLMYPAFKFVNNGHQTNIPEDEMKAFIVDEMRKCTDDNIQFA